MANWRVIEKNPDANDLALDIISLGLFGLSDREPQLYRIENIETGEQKVIKTLKNYHPGDLIPDGFFMEK